MAETASSSPYRSKSVRPSGISSVENGVVSCAERGMVDVQQLRRHQSARLVRCCHAACVQVFHQHRESGVQSLGVANLGKSEGVSSSSPFS